MRRSLLCAALIAATIAPAAHAQGEVPVDRFSCKWTGKGALIGFTTDPWDSAVVWAATAVAGNGGAVARDVVVTCSLQTARDYGTGTQLASVSSKPGPFGAVVLPPTVVKFSEPLAWDALPYICMSLTWIDADGTPGSYVEDIDDRVPGAQCY
jgi:hypothetical protein